MNTDRFKNPWFWIGIAGVIFTAMGVSPETFTSWEVVKESFMQVMGNPYMLGSIAITVLGVFVDPTTEGLMDKDK